jgi:hypothetical protein
MAFTIQSNVPGAAATGLSGQGHLQYAANQGAYWLFYLTGTQGLSALYSTNAGTSWSAPSYSASDGTTVSGSSFTLTAAHASEGRNFGFAYANISSTDVLHVLSSYNSSSSSASGYRARTTLGTTWTHTNAETQDGSTTNPGASWAGGGTCGLTSDFQRIDACSYFGGSTGGPGSAWGTHLDAGTSWNNGFSNTGGLDSTNNYNGSVFLSNDGNAGDMWLVADNSSSDVGGTNTGWTNLHFWTFTGGVAGNWGSKTNVFSSPVTATLPANWGAARRTTSDLHVVGLSDNGATGTYAHARYNGTSWSAGDAVPNLAYGTNSGLALATDGTYVWAFAFDTSKDLKYTKWISGTGWSAWTTLEGARTNTPAYVTAAYNGSNRIMVAWTEYTGSQYNIIGSTLSTSGATPSFTVSPATIPAHHSGNITLTLTGTSTSWVNGTTTFSLPSVTGLALVSTSINNGTQVATLTVTTGTGTGTGNITDSADGATAALTVATATLAISPTSGTTGTTPTVTLTGTHTLWTHETPSGLFSVSGGTGASIGTPTVSGDTSATATLTVGSAAGTLTIEDTSTTATATFTASAPASPSGAALLTTI